MTLEELARERKVELARLRRILEEEGLHVERDEAGRLVAVVLTLPRRDDWDAVSLVDNVRKLVTHVMSVGLEVKDEGLFMILDRCCLIIEAALSYHETRAGKRGNREEPDE